MRMRVQSLASLSGLSMQHCYDLWYRSHMWLRSCLAVAVCAAVALIQLLSWELPYATYAALKRKEKKKKQRNLGEEIKMGQ